MDDNSIMPFGKHKGKRLVDVPADYLLWCYENLTNLSKDLKEYIEGNKDFLEDEFRNKKNYKL